ncbi:hypothetical protein GQ607_002722 [Colletotrichum asianum]|uniref:Zn(2)-C6 fungal-type domain-containing protein n=1 Tax=Colletotrichum asianum TaxID=702518 RepID=A0A8H3WPG1_9PEZI|nr:hypothetical protein GQ607_002722 [Colletotrichum asianum]
MSRRVPDTITLPTWERDPTPPSPDSSPEVQVQPPRQPDPPQPQHENNYNSDPWAVDGGPPRPHAWNPPANSPPQNQHQSAYPDPYQAQPANPGYYDAPYGYQLADPGQQAYVEPGATLNPVAGGDFGQVLQDANANYPLAGLDTFHPGMYQQQVQQQQQQRRTQEQQIQGQQIQGQQQHNQQLNNPAQQQQQQQQGQQYNKSCRNCLRLKKGCSGSVPCARCFKLKRNCIFDPKYSKSQRKRMLEDIASGQNPQDDDDDETEDEDGPPAPKRARKQMGPDANAVFVQALQRIRPQLSNPDNGYCDHCLAGNNEGRDCDANHAEQFECSQCTRFRNLGDPNHVCRVRGGEYWQRRFENSRPTYPTNLPETSSCVGCKERRNAGFTKPTYCDIDPAVKIGCTQCRNEGRLCELYNERRADGDANAPPVQPWEQMWNRPMPYDGELVAGRRPWWRHTCGECVAELSKKRSWTPCSWTNDVRLGEYKCLTCVEKNRPCLDPWTRREYTNPYQWPGPGNDLLLATGGTVRRIGDKRCTNCKVTQYTCGGMEGQPDLACTKCTSWGLTCIVERNGREVTLPHPDRKAIGWRRTTTDKGHVFHACTECRHFNRNCDRKRPCDSCVSAGSNCDFLAPGTSGGRVPRDAVMGGDSADYYMALGYGPQGVDSARWGTRPDALVGPNRPSWIVREPPQGPPPRRQEAIYPGMGVISLQPTPAPVPAPVAAPPRQFGEEAAPVRRNPMRSAKNKPPAAQPQKPPKKVRIKAPKKAQPQAASQEAASSFLEGDTTLVNTPEPGNNKFSGDNNAAFEAINNGELFEDWLGDHTDQISLAFKSPSQPQVMPPFEGPPQNLEQIQQIVGQDLVMTDADAAAVADAVIDPELQKISNRAVADDKYQGIIRQHVYQAMTTFMQDNRFMPVELRNIKPPEFTTDLPATALVPPPARILLQLENAPASAEEANRIPHARRPKNEWDNHVFNNLLQWKRPVWNALASIPDAAKQLVTVDNRNRTCEEFDMQPVTGNVCGAAVANNAACESLEHMPARPAPYMVCDGCDLKTRRSLFMGTQPLNRAEFLRMRAYACRECSERERETADFGVIGKPEHPVTGCMCAEKLIGRRVCMHHRFRMAREMMVHTMFTSEWALTNFGPDACLFCKRGDDGHKAAKTVNDFMNQSLVYLCLNCQGVVVEPWTSELRDGIETMLGNIEPMTMAKQVWRPEGSDMALLTQAMIV